MKIEKVDEISPIKSECSEDIKDPDHVISTKMEEKGLAKNKIGTNSENKGEEEGVLTATAKYLP